MPGWHRVIGRARRPVLGIAGQFLNAGTNVATVYLASQLLAPAAFGDFVVVFAVVSVVLAAGRGLIGSTMQVHLPTLDEATRRSMVRSALGFTLLAGLVGSAVLAAIGVAAGATTVLWFAPWVTLALLHDAARYVFLSTERQGSALALDVAWALAQAAVIVAWLLAGGQESIGLLATAWGIGATAGFLLFVVLTRAVPARPGPWTRTTRDVAGWFTATAFVSQLELYLVLQLTGLLLGATDAGGLRAVQLLAYQPAIVVLGALSSVLTPGVVRARGDRDRLRAAVRTVAVTASPVALVLIAVALAREPLMALLFDQYVAFAALVVPIALQGVASTLALPCQVLLRALRRGATTFTVQVARLVVMVGAAAAGILVAGPAGLAWGLAAGATVVLALTAVLALRAARDDAGPVAAEDLAAAPAD
ncbi:hypothetical protein [Actinomycetospora aeridis]|uniref:O-antigen/teichoic acid export membrane protein n=1 Tax=Actinomycetospora aeridis TaxID=3129231 RepID=A0ABU8N6B5_9PSEU